MNKYKLDSPNLLKCIVRTRFAAQSQSVRDIDQVSLVQ